MTRVANPSISSLSTLPQQGTPAALEPQDTPAQRYTACATEIRVVQARPFSAPHLQSGEDGEVDAVLQVVHDVLALLVLALDSLAEEDHGTSRAPQRLVRRGRHHVRVVEGRRHHACSAHTCVFDLPHRIQNSGAALQLSQESSKGACSCTCEHPQMHCEKLRARGNSTAQSLWLSSTARDAEIAEAARALRDAGGGQELQLTSCNQAGDVGHVREQVGVALVCNVPHAGIVVVPASTPRSASYASTPGCHKHAESVFKGHI